MLFGSTQIGLPAPSGTCHLVDGTVIRIAAAAPSDAGDPIEGTLELGGASMEVAAEGLVAAG
mgnify:FL=1